ncbi:MAG: CPBP family intramembrane metalloprotease [Defluviitaleaceae bacterium]|nr:CPBP family intramembrane metalloprotease [Defluviitaleaceae bacterium]
MKTNKAIVMRSFGLLLILIFHLITFSFVFSYLFFILNIRLSFFAQVILSQIFSFFLPFLIYLLITGKKINDIIPLKTLSIKNTMFIFAIVFSAIPLANLISFISSLFFTNQIENILLPAITNYPLGLLLLSIAVTPSILEEIIFRGVFYKELEKLPIKTAAILNGLFFGIIHMNFQQFFYTFILGILLTYIFYYTKSILAPMLAHFIFNGFSVVYTYWVLNNFNFTENRINEIIDNQETSIFGIVFISLILILCFFVFVNLMKKFVEYNTQKQNI